MRKILTSALAAITAAGAVAATATPAEAQRRHHRHHGGGDDEVAAAILGGVAGLALGAALSNGNRRDPGYYADRRYSNGYGYDPRYDTYSGGYYRYDERPRYRYRTCISRDRVYDPYIGRRVTIERRYRC